MAGAQAGGELGLEVGEVVARLRGELLGPFGAELEGGAQRRIELVAAGGDRVGVQLDVAARPVVELGGVAQHGIEAAGADLLRASR